MMELEHRSSCIACGSRLLHAADAPRRLTGCRECGLVFANPRPTAESIAEFYSRPAKYDHWVAREAARKRMWQRRLGKLGGLAIGGAVLDVGAGIGEFLHYAGDRFARRTGTEISEEAVRVARERHGVELLQGRFESMAFDEPFDLVTLFHVLEHVPEPRLTLERAFAALRPGGHLVVAVPNDLGAARLKLKALLARLGLPQFAALGRLGLAAITLDARQEEVHLSHFGPTVLERLLRSVGFVAVQTSLDPYSAEAGPRRFQHDVRYAAGSALEKLTGFNLYDTIWAQAQRPPRPD